MVLSWPRLLAIGALIAAGCSFSPDEVAADAASASDGAADGDGTSGDDGAGEDGATVLDASDACEPLPAEICNGIDDDCDGVPDEDLGLGASCDGLDGDLCAEGMQICDGAGGVTCNDLTGDSVEACNGADDDCDGGTDEDFDFGSVATCGNCTTSCVNPNGRTTCSGGTCAPVCNELTGDCDTSRPNGCELQRDTNPVCMTSTALGTVSGDVSSSVIATTGLRERWFIFGVTENDTDDFEDLTARVDLQSPPGLDFDLYVYCYSCGGSLSGSSTNGPGLLDSVDVRREDVSGFTDYNVLVEVRALSGTACGSWTLSVTGDVTVPSVTCL